MRKVAYIDPGRCDKSPFCPVKRVCSEEAISQEGSFFSAKVPKVDPNKCIGCNKCVNYCPHQAVSMRTI